MVTQGPQTAGLAHSSLQQEQMQGQRVLRPLAECVAELETEQQQGTELGTEQQVTELGTKQVTDSWLLSSGEQKQVQGLAEHQPSPPWEQILGHGKIGVWLPSPWELM